ncbi:hypothetical protein LX32DRAFT_636876 [Colletotrichum zoysiae]|uniref:Uncharacterized protein n=1 Tax=Colletotrichum zoysiae TaxID=1216348 RepID=A0AAD9M2L4_9PEZI|nr:hypothetical protein LX32DRAFT_636876 [Colletotrichum zoysiae]
MAEPTEGTGNRDKETDVVKPDNKLTGDASNSPKTAMSNDTELTDADRSPERAISNDTELIDADNSSERAIPNDTKLTGNADNSSELVDADNSSELTGADKSLKGGPPKENAKLTGDASNSSELTGADKSLKRGPPKENANLTGDASKSPKRGPAEGRPFKKAKRDMAYLDALAGADRPVDKAPAQSPDIPPRQVGASNRQVSRERDTKMAVTRGDLERALFLWSPSRRRVSIKDVFGRDQADTVEKAVLLTLCDLPEPPTLPDIYIIMPLVRSKAYNVAIRQGLDDVGTEAADFMVLVHLWKYFHKAKELTSFPWMKHKPDRMAGGSDEAFQSYRRLRKQ